MSERSKENKVCGCGECSVCEALTKRLKDNLSPEQKAFDRHVTRTDRATIRNLEGMFERKNHENRISQDGEED